MVVRQIRAASQPDVDAAGARGVVDFDGMRWLRGEEAGVGAAGGGCVRAGMRGCARGFGDALQARWHTWSWAGAVEAR